MFKEFFTGVGLLGRGFKLWGTSPKLMLLGALPALIVALIYLALIVFLLTQVGGLAETVTPFARGWDAPWRDAVRLLAGSAIVGVAVVLLVVTYSVVTQTVGQPFYEVIARAAEQPYGGVPNEVELRFWPSVGRGLAEGIRMLLVTLLVGIGVFVVGLIPVVGVIAPVLGALTGGWFLALELTGVAFERRGLRLRDRRRALGAHRSASLGFGVAVFVLFLIPGGAVVTMPAAVAGGSLLTRRALGAAV